MKKSVSCVAPLCCFLSELAISLIRYSYILLFVLIMIHVVQPIVFHRVAVATVYHRIALSLNRFCARASLLTKNLSLTPGKSCNGCTHTVRPTTLHFSEKFADVRVIMLTPFI